MEAVINLHGGWHEDRRCHHLLKVEVLLIVVSIEILKMYHTDNIINTVFIYKNTAIPALNESVRQFFLGTGCRHSLKIYSVSEDILNLSV